MTNNLKYRTIRLAIHFHRLSSLAIIVILTVFLIMGCDEKKDDELPELDVWITAMEITQGIQTTTNTIPLVAQRATTVRVYLGSDEIEGLLGPVTGELSVTVNGIPHTPSTEPIQIPAVLLPNPNRDFEDHTLNFELPAPTGITASSRVSFEVTIDYEFDSDASNNSFTVENLTFTQLANPRLFYVLLDYVPAASGPPNAGAVEAGIGEAMVRGIFPVEDNDSYLYEPALMNNVVFFEQDDDGDGLIDSLAETSALMSTLANIRNLLVDSLATPATYTFLYGWLNESPMDGFGGMGQVGGYNAFGNTTLYQYQRSYAHELGHNFGLEHNERIISPEVGWDTGARLSDNPEENNVSGYTKPGTYVDIMNSGPATNGTWIDTTSYKALFDRMLAEINAPVASLTNTPPPIVQNVAYSESETDSVLVVQGYFNGPGNKLLHLYPVLRLARPAAPWPREESGKFTAVLIADDGRQQSYPFNARICYEGLNSIRHGFFELGIPLPPSFKVRDLTILNSETGKRMGGFRASKPASVKILSPTADSRLPRETTVTWEVKGPERSPGERRFHLQYSPDGGVTWSVLGVNIYKNSFRFDAAKIAPAVDGKGIIKLYACDGLNTTTHEISGLSSVVPD